MRKVLFSIAIVTAGLFVVSCGNKSAASGEGADSTIVEADQLPADFVHYESACYEFDCPEALKQGRMGDSIFLSNSPERDASIHVNMMTENVPTATDFKQFAEKKIAERKKYMEILQEPTIEERLLSVRCKDDQRDKIIEFFYVLGENGNMAYGNFEYSSSAANKYEAAVKPFVKSIVVK